MNIKRYTAESLFLFILSPFLTVFFQIFFIVRGSRFALNILILILGLIGFIFVPSFTNDKTRYYERYEEIKNYNIGQYLDYLVVQGRPDFIFETLNYFFASNGLNIQYLFFAINTFSIYTLFKITDLITNYFLNNKKRAICFFLILCSFAIQHLYSGIRFTFASCIFLWGVYFLIYKKKNIIAYLFLLTSVLTHFSMTLFVMVILFFHFFRNINYKYFLYISFLFLILPREIISQLINGLSLDGGYSTKVDIYVNGEEFITQNFQNNVSSIIVYYIRNAWIYVAYIVLIFERNTKDKLTQLLFLFVAALNVFYAFPTIYSRYLILIKFLFTIYIIYKYIDGKSRITYLFLGLYFLTTVIDIYVIRPNFIATFSDSSIISLFTTLLREVGLNQMIDNRM